MIVASKVVADNPIDRLTELSVLKPTDRLKARYRRLILISHCCHLAALNADDTDSLVISTDWLSWRKWVDKGGHGIHYETAMEYWPDDTDSPLELYLRSSRWMIDENGNDITEFRGVSMGKQFLQDSALFTKSYERLLCALHRLTEQFKPEEILLIDVQTENQLLDDALKRTLVAEVAESHGALFIDALDPPDPADPLWPDTLHMGINTPESGFRPWLRKIYSLTVGAIFYITAPHLRNRPKIFILNNWQVIEPLMKAFDSDRLTLVLLAGQWPKNLRFLWRCWRRGILLTNLPSGRLTRSEEDEVNDIPGKVIAAWNAPAEGMELRRREFIRGRVFDKGWLKSRAPMVKRYERFFQRHRFARVGIGDAGNALNRLIAEIANLNGVPVDELSNGMLLSDQKLDIRTGDAYGPPLISQFFAWGLQQEEWLRATGSPVKSVRTGYPGIDIVAAEADRPSVSRQSEKILILGSWVDGYDIHGLHSTKISYSVEIVRELKNLGFKTIRLKIHPGTPRLSYYQEAFRYYDLDCEIYKSGPLTEHLKWADLVIGPVSSGSLIETFAVGKPYFALRHYPSLMARKYTDRLQAFDTPRDLVAALVAGWRPDRQAILKYLCAFGEIPDASLRFWQVIEGSLDCGTKTLSKGLEK
ncbi:MAG: hypothetical protein HQ503_18980 [Rhodospirillales bacterium]|nr:hypothetical protein [Rhodospirillales bacterium]